MQLLIEKNMQKNAYKFFLKKEILHAMDFKLAIAIPSETRFKYIKYFLKDFIFRNSYRKY